MTSLLVIDDDEAFRTVLAQALGARDFEVRTAANGAEALALAQAFAPEYVVLDLTMRGPGGAWESGLALIQPLLALEPFTRILVLTGYASVETAVEAIKLGAVHYLAKPAGIEAILASFAREEGDASVCVQPRPQTVSEVEWRHIAQMLRTHDGNISRAARDLKMHRRTLQRKIDKMPRRFLEEWTTPVQSP